MTCKHIEKIGTDKQNGFTKSKLSHIDNLAGQKNAQRAESRIKFRPMCSILVMALLGFKRTSSCQLRDIDLLVFRG